MVFFSFFILVFGFWVIIMKSDQKKIMSRMWKVVKEATIFFFFFLLREIKMADGGESRRRWMKTLKKKIERTLNVFFCCYGILMLIDLGFDGDLCRDFPRIVL